MANAHRTNVLVTSCLKTPVDPHTKAPVALYERERAVPCGPCPVITGHSMRHNLDFLQREVSDKMVQSVNEQSLSVVSYKVSASP